MSINDAAENYIWEQKTKFSCPECHGLGYLPEIYSEWETNYTDCPLCQCSGIADWVTRIKYGMKDE